MKLGSLFAGIGGFELAATWAGIEPIWSNEINSNCCSVLRKNFKHKIIEADIRTIGKQNLETVDIITGGFPCQPFSTAGTQKGTKDDRYLWPEMLRIIREIQPRYIVAENVYGIINHESGLVFETVCSQMENAGYEVQPVIIPACAIGAQIRRDRVWFIGRLSVTCGIRQKSNKKISQRQQYRKGGASFNIIDPLYRLSTTEYKRSESTFVGGTDGISEELDEIEGYVNAIVPQVALQFFELIKLIEQ